MARMGTVAQCIVLTLVLVNYASGQDLFKPNITDFSALSGFLSESLKENAYIGRIYAYDPDGSDVEFYLEGQGAEYFQIDRQSGNVTLKKLLDYDILTDKEISMEIIVIDGQNQIKRYKTSIVVEDVNDVKPSFTKQSYYKEISEDMEPGLEVAIIDVTDVDKTNSDLSVVCIGTIESFRDACEKFELKITEYSNEDWKGKLILAQDLDFETRSSYAIKLEARDGLNFATVEVHVEVKDINDTPPRWIKANDVRIKEERKLGSVTTNVIAVDQDTEDRRAITYDLIEDHTNVFMINSTTGDIIQIGRIDFDDDSVQGELVFDLAVRASEVISDNPFVVGNDSFTTVTTVISVTVEDIDDNNPIFDEPIYRVKMKEDIETRANIPGLQMTVTDRDSGIFNSFDLLVLDYEDTFGIIPAKDAKSSSATLFIKDSGRIDFEVGPPVYEIRVMARENLVPVALSGTAIVQIKVEDVNDIVPEFSGQGAYQTVVYEDIKAGETVIDVQAFDKEADNFGTAGIRYALYSNQLNHFKIDAQSGKITAGECKPGDQHGKWPCIDFERKESYRLTVSATDDFGNGNSRSAPVIIIVKDVNDNVPELLPDYEAYIYEEEVITVSPLIINAQDPDTVGGPLVYRLLGEFSPFQIIAQGPDTAIVGNITATRPVQYSDAEDLNTGEVNFEVVASDLRSSKKANVKITILDINNNEPQFVQRDYEQFIKEDTKGKVLIQKIEATDGDAPTTGNGRLEFEIETGAQGKFWVENIDYENTVWSSEVHTTPDATFDFETQKQYILTLVARDQGTPRSKSGTATLTVNILDINNNAPQIDPPSASITVVENEPIGTEVHTILATDPDQNSELRYYFVATSARNDSGGDVDKKNVDYTKMFELNSQTGIVSVKSALNRDLTSFISYQLLVQDINGSPVQTGTGALYITILEYNDQSPQFLSDPYVKSIDEEVNLNYLVQNIKCTDADDKISGYSIRQIIPPLPEYFALSGNSGGIIVNSRIDYEKIQYIELEGTCRDSGIPQRSNTTKIEIFIRNLNDNSPEFDEPLYQASLLERTLAGTSVVTVSAVDIDLLDYGIVRYKMADPNLPFAIDPILGNISVSNTTVFDRESKASYSFQVIAYDSPNTPSDRRETKVPVYISIIDINDNCPVFQKPLYTTSIPESAPSGTDVIDIVAEDKDTDINGAIYFALTSGSFSPPGGEGYFAINTRSGRITTKDNLRKKSGFYFFNVTAADMNGQQSPLACKTEVPVEIEVTESENNFPLWKRPPRRDFVIYVLESQYEGMLVYHAEAKDPDKGIMGVIDYSFLVGDDLVQNTAEFRINKITGVIRAEIEYDREDVDRYFLTLMAKDRGVPAASSRTTLTVIILDVDDNDPKFSMKDGVVVPLTLPETPLGENTDPGVNGVPLGRCNATDLDSDHKNNRIFYQLYAPEDLIKETISIQRDTCDIRLIKKVDFETTPILRFNIYAFNERSDDTVQRTRRSTNPSILPVVINVGDVNDNRPVFTQTHYMACAYLDNPLLTEILIVGTTDPDGSSTHRYSLVDTNIFTIFQSGVIRNSQSLYIRRGTVHTFEVKAEDADFSTTAKVTIFVIGSDNQVRIKQNRPRMDTFASQAAAVITDENPDIDFTCAKADDFINEDGKPSTYSSELVVAAVRINTQTQPNTYHVYSSDELINILDGGNTEYISVTKEDDDEISFSEDSVIIIFILCLLLIIIALFLFCLACYCIRDRKKKKTKKIKAQRHTIVQVTTEEQGSSFQNPVYHNVGYKPDESEYATVSKVKHIAPVVIAAPQNLEPYDNQPPTELVPDPEPVIVTEVERPETPPMLPEPEFDDVIETTVLEDTPIPEPMPEPPVDEDVIEVEFGDEPLPSPLPPSDGVIDVEILDEPSFQIPPEDDTIETIILEQS